MKHESKKYRKQYDPVALYRSFTNLKRHGITYTGSPFPLADTATQRARDGLIFHSLPDIDGV
jgi:hypothetical protein